ncbi:MULTISPECIES: ribokinase [Metabacillus]|uniref:Ribokinase n=2 Tax=Metabacillus TaxID=2675233 RepID=A0A179SZU4_9BACI|nr:MULTISPECIES: ribokinase [Metabacillus]OAS85822.1 ribokinase [Metabacillus litoralis]QNF27190.1 ribokinase [Metabacillus sp. KUDC1714]
MSKPKITVIGSINMDLVTKTNTIPKVGETVLGESFFTIPGGKGANQAVAAARLGAEVTMIGCVGDDAFGSELKNHLTAQGVSMENVKTIPETSTGIASITLSNGDNSIIIVSGANHFVTPEVVKQHEHIIAESDIVLLQLEVPLQSVIEAVQLARKHNVRVILNPAPIQKLPKELILQVDYITPNEHEQEMLLSRNDMTDEELIQVKEKCIVTKGSKGVMLYQNGETFIQGYKVKAVDSTGAGDSFNGALAFSLSNGAALKESCQFANAVAALSVTKLGAQAGMPTLQEAEEFISTR